MYYFCCRTQLIVISFQCSTRRQYLVFDVFNLKYLIEWIKILIRRRLKTILHLWLIDALFVVMNELVYERIQGNLLVD